MSLLIGKSESEQIRIDVTGYERDISGEYYDDNWLAGQVSVSFGGFKGHFSAAFLTGDFLSFLPQLEQLYNSLNGAARFETLEQQIAFTLTGNGLGGIALEGEVRDSCGYGNALTFQSELDQSDLAITIRQLRNLVQTYPERCSS